MGMLCDLPGVKKKKVEAAHAGSQSAMVRLAREGKYPTTAGDNGAITVWRRDDGDYQCRFDRYKVNLSNLQTPKLSEVWKWLREWWPQMERS